MESGTWSARTAPGSRRSTACGDGWAWTVAPAWSARSGRASISRMASGRGRSPADQGSGSVHRVTGLSHCRCQDRWTARTLWAAMSAQEVEASLCQRRISAPPTASTSSAETVRARPPSLRKSPESPPSRLPKVVIRRRLALLLGDLRIAARPLILSSRGKRSLRVVTAVTLAPAREGRATAAAPRPGAGRPRPPGTPAGRRRPGSVARPAAGPGGRPGHPRTAARGRALRSG